MSLKHILLGMLAEPHSGYDLKKQFDQSLRNFWRAELSQIYPLLQRMENDGLLSSRDAASEIGPTRRVYRRTAKGRRELHEWLNAGPVVGVERIEYLAQTFFLAQLDTPDEAIAFMESLRDYVAERLEHLENVERGWSADDPRYPDALPDEDFYPQLTLDLGIARMRGTLDWCERAIERINARRTAESRKPRAVSVSS